MPAFICGFSNAGEAASAPASTSQTAADTSVQPSSSALSTSHPATDLLASRLATPPPPAAQGASPAPQLPFPLKKKQYRAEPAPSFPSPTDGERDAPAEDAAVGGHPSSMAEKQVGLHEAKMLFSSHNWGLLMRQPWAIPKAYVAGQ